MQFHIISRISVLVLGTKKRPVNYVFNLKEDALLLLRTKIGELFE